MLVTFSWVPAGQEFPVASSYPFNEAPKLVPLETKYERQPSVLVGVQVTMLEEHEITCG